MLTLHCICMHGLPLIFLFGRMTGNTETTSSGAPFSSDALPRSLLQQVHVRAIDLTGGARHADLAGAAAGVALIRLPSLHFRRLVLRRRFRQFGEQES